MSKRADQLAEQVQEAGAFALDLLAPGLREKLARFAPSSGAEDSDIVAPAADACETCDGARELTNVRGKKIPCPDCGGSR